MMQPSEFGKRNPSTSLQQSCVNYNKSRFSASEGSRVFKSLSEGLNNILADLPSNRQLPKNEDLTDHQKEIFVGGLSTKLTKKELSWAFSYFGRVTHVRIMSRPDGSTRGFAFVKYKHVRSAEAAVKRGFLTIGNITTEIRSCISVNQSEVYKDHKLKCKVFIGGISSKLQHSDILNYLSLYGEVLDFIPAQDPITGNFKGFGFATFAEQSSVDLFLSQKKGHKINGFRIKSGPAVVKKEVSEGSQKHSPNTKQIPKKAASGSENGSWSQISVSTSHKRWIFLEHPEENLVFNLRVTKPTFARMRHSHTPTGSQGNRPDSS